MCPAEALNERLGLRGVVLAMATMGLAMVSADGTASATAWRFKRAAHLRHGINLSMWYAQTKDFSASTHLDAYTNTTDFAMIKSLGFDHVRLSIDPEWLIDEAAGREL